MLQAVPSAVGQLPTEATAALPAAALPAAASPPAAASLPAAPLSVATLPAAALQVNSITSITSDKLTKEDGFPAPVMKAANAARSMGEVDSSSPDDKQLANGDVNTGTTAELGCG